MCNFSFTKPILFVNRSDFKMKLFIKNISIVGFFAFMVLLCTVSVSANEYMDFEYEEDEYGIYITDYIGENKNVIVPNEINGKEVSSVYIANDNVEFIKFPDYMSTYDNIGFGKNVKGIMVNNLRYMDFSYLKNSGGYDYSDTSICKFFVTGSVDTDVDSWSVVPDKIQNAIIYSGCEIKNDFIYSSGCEIKNNFYSSGLVDYIGENKNVTITETDIESGYMRLGDYAFYNNDIIESVYFKFEGNKYAQPGTYNFYNCNNLKEVYGLLTSGYSDVFLECDKLVRSYFGWIGTVYTDEWIYLPNPEQPTNASIVGYLGEDTNIVIPSYIDGYKITGFANVFEANITVTDVTMPDTVTKLSSNAFKNCEALKNIKLSENIDVINDYSFFGCSKLTNIKIPDGVKSIYSFAFCNSSLSEITLPNGLERIAEYAFAGTKLSEIFIPPTVSYLDSSAFLSCESLSKIYLPLHLEGQKDSIKNGIKPNSSTDVKIYCCVNYYVDDEYISTEYVTKSNSATVEEYLPESYIDNYILLVNNEIWDKQNVNENLDVIVKNKYYTVTYSGAIDEEQTVEYMQDAILPVCEDNGYEFRFKYNGAFGMAKL